MKKQSCCFSFPNVDEFAWNRKFRIGLAAPVSGKYAIVRRSLDCKTSYSIVQLRKGGFIPFERNVDRINIETPPLTLRQSKTFTKLVKRRQMNRYWPEAKRKTVLTLREKGHTIQTISDKTKIPTSTVYSWVRKEFLKHPRKAALRFKAAATRT